jgi:hypothetical protein
MYFYLKQLIPSAIFLSMVFASSCGPSEQELADSRLDYAKQLLAENRYNEAKILLDSLRENFPSLSEKINEGMKMLNRVELKEQIQSFAYYDSLLVLRSKEFEEIKRNFVYDPGPGKGYVGTYVHKKQQVANSFDRVFIKAIVTDNGDFYVSSRYKGADNINHKALKVYFDGLFAQSNEVPLGIDNRRFDDGEDQWEIINYKDQYDNGVAMFIANNADKNLKAVYLGSKPYYIVLESYDKEAVVQSHALSQLIKSIADLQKSIEMTQKRIEELRKNI